MSKLIGPMRRLPPIMAVIAAVLAVAGCGGGGRRRRATAPPTCPSKGGLRDEGRAAAAAPAAADFPAVEGRSLQEVADSMQGGPEVGLAGQTYTPATTGSRSA